MNNTSTVKEYENILSKIKRSIDVMIGADTLLPWNCDTAVMFRYLAHSDWFKRCRQLCTVAVQWLMIFVGSFIRNQLLLFHFFKQLIFFPYRREDRIWEKTVRSVSCEGVFAFRLQKKQKNIMFRIQTSCVSCNSPSLALRFFFLPILPINFLLFSLFSLTTLLFLSSLTLLSLFPPYFLSLNC